MRCTWGWWRRRPGRPRSPRGEPATEAGCTAAGVLRAQRQRRGLSREQAVLCMQPSLRMSARWLRAVEEGTREWVRDLDRGLLPELSRQRAALDDLLRVYGVSSGDLLAEVVRTAPERTRPAPRPGARPGTRGGARRPSAAWRRRLALAGRSGVAGAIVLAGVALTADGRVAGGIRLSAKQVTPAPSLRVLPSHPAGVPGGTQPPAPATVAAPAVAAAGSPPPAVPTGVPGTGAPRRPVAVAGPRAAAPLPPAEPLAALSTTLVDFGAVPVGSSVSRTVSLANAGRGTLHVDRLVRFWADEVAIGDDTCSGRGLLPGERCSFVLTYTPSRTGMLAPFPHVEVVDDAPGGSQEIELRGSTT